MKETDRKIFFPVYIMYVEIIKDLQICLFRIIRRLTECQAKLLIINFGWAFLSSYICCFLPLTIIPTIIKINEAYDSIH